MAFETLNVKLETANFLKERDESLIFGRICTRAYNGEINKRGDTIVLDVLGTPTIYDIDKNGTYTLSQLGTNSVAGTGRDVIQKGLPDPEEVATATMEVTVNKVYAFNFMVGDIDQQLSSKKGLIGQIRGNAAKALASKQDLYIATKLVGTTALLNPNYVSGTVIVSQKASESDGTNTNVLEIFDDAVRVLNERDVWDDANLVAIVSPKLWTQIKKAYKELDTNNSAMLSGRPCGVYNGIKIMKSNNTTVSAQEYCFIGVENAVAFFDPLTQVKAYSPEKGFSDAIKGMNFFDCAVVKPKEMLVTLVNYEAITSA